MTPTDEQKRIYNFIKYDSSHGIIDAVAGSGKTTAIIESIGYTSQDKSLLFCAFNKKIRDEIQKRVIEKRHSNTTVKNLHQLGFDILKSHSTNKYVLQPNKYRQIVNRIIKRDLTEFVEEYCTLYDVNTNPFKSYEVSILKKTINAFKNKLLSICDKYRLTLTKNDLDLFEEMVSHYNIIDQKLMNERNFKREVALFFSAKDVVLNYANNIAKSDQLIDFADMLYLPEKFDLSPRSTYDILFVDECQDLSKSQFNVALKYVKRNGRVLAVGDPYQSIYGFTGADIRSFDRFSKLPNHVKLNLSYCFRCPDIVLDYAQQFREDIKPFKPKDGIIEQIDFEDIDKFLEEGDLVIGRTKAPLTTLFFTLLEKNMKVNIHQDDIQELFNELRFLFSKEELTTSNVFKNNYDFFEKVKNRNIYFAEQNANKISNTTESDEFLTTQTDYIERRVNFLKRQSSIHVEVNTINDLIKRIENLVSEDDDAIKLSTIHKAKGLESERVFILDYDKLPLKKDEHQPWEVEQERNLKYVALTRTKHTLFLVNAMKDADNEEEDTGSLYDALGDIDF